MGIMHQVLNKSLLVKDLLLLGKIIKKILIFEFLFSLLLHAEYVNFIPPKPGNAYSDYVQTNKIKDKDEYQNVKLNFDLEQLGQQYEKWKKINTGTYTYICRPNTFFGRNIEAILFVKNNIIVKRIVLPHDSSKKFPLYKTLHLVDSRDNEFTKTRRYRAILRGHLNCHIDKVFVDILGNFFNSSQYVNFEVDLKYNTKYSFISNLSVKRIPNTRYLSSHSHSWSVNLYGMLMLPKNTQFTDDIVQKILNQYKQAWECEKKLLASKKINNEQNLTMLEKAVGKEKLECLDEYLVWDKNVSEK
jgi:hypothetical protein